MAAFWLPGMLTQEEAVEIKVLPRREMRIREIARQLSLLNSLLLLPGFSRLEIL